MSDCMMGVYWHDRSRTLRQFADETKRFLQELAKLHSVFQTLEWVGDRPNAAVKLAPDLSNLEDLVFRHAGNDFLVDAKDGELSWESIRLIGFAMRFNSGKSSSAGGVTVSIRAGQPGKSTPNSSVISWPSSDDSRFPYREFHTYQFIQKLFVLLLNQWQPETGRVSSSSFSKAVSGDELPGVGWLTYIRDSRAEAIRHDQTFADIEVERPPDGGVLFSLGQKIISADDLEQIHKARKLRQKLISEQFIVA